MRSRYKVLDSQQIYFITSTIINWIPIFINKLYYDILIGSIEYCQIQKELKIHAYVLLDNHFHMIVSNDNLSKTISSLKRNLAKEILKQLKKDKNQKILDLFQTLKPRYKNESYHQVWQEGFHPQIISTDNILEQKINYIHLNPVRRGLVIEPVDWMYSSANFYSTGRTGVLEVEELM